MTTQAMLLVWMLEHMQDNSASLMYPGIRSFILMSELTPLPAPVFLGRCFQFNRLRNAFSAPSLNRIDSDTLHQTMASVGRLRMKRG